MPPCPSTRARLDAKTAIDAPLALALGFLPVTVIDVGLTLARFELGYPGVRALHLMYLIGYRGALALVLALAAAVLMQVRAAFATRPRIGGLATAALLVLALLVVGPPIFADDVYSYLPQQRLGLVVMLSLLPAALVGLRMLAGLARTRRSAGLLRIPFVLVGLGATLANDLLLPFGNRGPHLGLLVVAGLAFGLALVGQELRTPGWRPRGTARRFTGLALASLALWSLLVTPPSRVAFELARSDSPGLYAFLAPLRPGPDADESDVVVDDLWLSRFAGAPRWFERHDDAPPVAPSRPLMDPAQAIVVLLTIDALREDVFSDPRNAALMPILTALRAESTVFTQAHASSSSTAPSIGSIFTGRYLSQLYLTPVPFQGRIRYYPVDDRSPRVPELLPRAVRSFNVPSTERLRQAYGLIRGMRDEASTDTTGHLQAAEVLPILGDWLVALGPGPAFATTHLMDGHAPYTSAGTEGSHFERHVREFGVLDAQLGEFIARLEDAGLWSRTVLIIAADHGEAFGEHGQFEHGATLHEELTRVPILIHVPGQAAREVAQPVSLIDLGPTILDLFQQPTPGGFHGQSLVPLIAGGDAALDRPIAIESMRLHRALIFRDGFKCIWRSREHQYELYDLNSDPMEQDNIVASEPTAPARMAAVRRFFRAHEHIRPGYATPHHWP